MESPLLHPYSLLRRGLSASVSRLSIRSPRPPSYENWESPRPSTASDVDSATAFASVGAPLLDKSEYPYVKHSSGITLLLSGHRAGTSLPLYPSGSLMSGMVVLTKLQGVSALDVKLEAATSVREIQGGGRSSIVVFSDELLAWNSNAGLPEEFAFRRIVPIFSHDGRLLPPTFDSRLSAVPGFRVSVNWSIVVTVSRARTSPLSLFRRPTRLVVPIRYIPRTRPSFSGPFPLLSTPMSPAHPRTSFVDIVPTRKELTMPIHTEIYLPNSQITPMCDAIPFRITLSAPSSYLDPFLSAASQSSFLPMSSAAAPSSDPTSGPVCVHLVRRIGADPRETFVVVVGELATPATRGTVLADGLLSHPELDQDSVSWWGQFRVPLNRAKPGGFLTDRLAVQDALVLTLNVPNMHTHEFPFRQVVPMRLTTDLAETSEALAVTDV